LITAELVDLASGYIGAKEQLAMALQSGTTYQGRGFGPTREDLLSNLARDMPFTDSIGAETLVLEEPAIDALATFRANHSLVVKYLTDSPPGAPSGLMIHMTTNMKIAHTMGILAKCFDHFAPTRKFDLDSNEPKLASTILREFAAQGS
jgi:hypothetical protein